MPPDFPEVFVWLGHKTIEDYYACGIGTVKRWMREYGEAELIQLRRAYLRKLAASRGINHLAGRKPGKLFGGFPEMRVGNAALDWMPVRRLRRPFREDVWIRFPDARSRPCPEEY